MTLLMIACELYVTTPPEHSTTTPPADTQLLTELKTPVPSIMPDVASPQLTLGTVKVVAAEYVVELSGIAFALAGPPFVMSATPA